MKLFWRLVCMTALCIGSAQAARDISPDGQDTPTQSLDQESEKTAYPGLISVKMADPSLTSPIGPPGLGLQLTTDNKDRKAKAKIGLRIGNDFFFDVKFIVPVGDADAEVEPIDLDGLARSSVIDLGIHYLSWNPKLDADKARAILTEYLARNPEKKNFVLTLNNLKSEPDLRRRFLEAVAWKIAFFAALRAKVGRQDFTYADSNFKSFSEQKTSFALEAAAGVLIPGWGYIGFNFETQKFYEAGNSVDLILPYRGGPVQQIKSYIIGPPGKRDRNKLQLEYRKTIGSFGAINPRISYFPKDKAALIELPVYLFQNPDAGLNGGINLAWTSKNGGRLGLALFIGSTFSLTPE